MQRGDEQSLGIVYQGGQSRSLLFDPKSALGY
jgi:hypothetical protein